MITDIWKVNIKGNSMEGLFSDGQILRARVWINFAAESDLHIGRIVILKKEKAAARPSSSEIEIPSQIEKPVFIIHRIVGRFCFKGQLSFWEKGDNDYFPKECYPEDIAAIVIGIEGHEEIAERLQPDFWQERNRNLVRFYKIFGIVYALAGDGRGEHRKKIFYKVWRKGFWSSFYFLCSFFNLKGH
jgi:hypothetical protein